MVRKDRVDRNLGSSQHENAEHEEKTQETIVYDWERRKLKLKFLRPPGLFSDDSARSGELCRA